MQRPTLPIRANNVFFYYTDLDRAAQFYSRTMGFRLVADYGSARIFQIAATSFLTLVDSSIGMHSVEEPKTVTLDCVVSDLEGWYKYLVEQQGVPLARELSADPAQAHDGFVVMDPEGYYVEIERFNVHPANAQLLPLLDALSPMVPDAATETQRPAQLAITGTVIWLYYQDVEAGQHFLAETLGLQWIFEQEIATLYAASPSGFLGTVIAGEGLHPASEHKAVTISLLTDEIDVWYAWLQAHPDIRLRTEEVVTRERYKAFVAYAPENYFFEFNTFLDHPDNQEFMRALHLT
jgi:catechol 2,3-dioxygenase-like lactoylglutathione lyase family enzyme